jgi:glycosyltransferase involved in cell wall biosynthesis
MSQVIVTLTTIPSRLTPESYEYGIKSNIDSLLNQDYEGEYEIHFNVPSILKHTGEPYIIPEEIKEIANNNSKFKIFDNLEDLGPVTKLAYTLKRITDPEAIIIVCDDDLIYHPGMVKEQVNNQSKYPNTAVGYDGCGALDPTVFDDVRNHYVVSVYKDIEVNILQHYKTISYRRKFFEDDFFTDFIPYSWNDDISVSAYMGKQGIKKLVACYEHEEPLFTIEEWRAKGGVTTFPVLEHTTHQREEGCTLYRNAKLDDNYVYFSRAGYLK